MTSVRGTILSKPSWTLWSLSFMMLSTPGLWDWTLSFQTLLRFNFQLQSCNNTDYYIAFWFYPTTSNFVHVCHPIVVLCSNPPSTLGWWIPSGGCANFSISLHDTGRWTANLLCMGTYFEINPSQWFWVLEGDRWGEVHCGTHAMWETHVICIDYPC